VKALGSPEELRFILHGLRAREVGGTPGVAVKCADIWRKAGGEGVLLAGF